MKIFIIISNLFLLSCVDDAPPAPSVKVYVMLSDENQACRTPDDGPEECISFKEMDGYTAMSPDDTGELARYIVELNSRCKKWGKDFKHNEIAKDFSDFIVVNGL